jgi:phosphoglycolate phosphatase
VSRYKHIIWDWNGTLLDDEWLSVEIINEILAKYKKPGLTRETYRQIFNFPVRDYYLSLGFNFEITPFEQVGSEYIQKYLARWRECRLHTNAIDILDFFQKKGLTQSILSAAQYELIKDGVRYYNIETYFSNLSGLHHYYAPGKSDIARHFISKIGILPEHILVIGDTTHDYEVAQEIGSDCLLFNKGHHAPEKLSACNSPVVTDLLDCKYYI